MRTRVFIRILLAMIVASVPFVGHAAVSDPFIYDGHFIGARQIAGAPYGTYQTAFRSGDTPTFQVFVHSDFGTPPEVSADLLKFGLSDSATTSGQSAGPAAQYPQAYFYNFGPLSIASDMPDGIYEIPITATNMIGSTTMATTSILIDNTPPVLSLAPVSFSASTTSPQVGDTLFLSGTASGTGTALHIWSVTGTLLNGQQQPLGQWPYYTASYDPAPLNAAIASSTDGTFSNVPYRLMEGSPVGGLAQAAFLNIEIKGYDEAGNTVTINQIVPLVPPNPCATPGACASNVLFLPGIEGSRLYEGTSCGKKSEEKLWEPIDSDFRAALGAGDGKVGDLSLDPSGASVCSDVYTKEGDVIDAVHGVNLYASLIGEMNGIKSSGTINDWKPVAYDWRLSLEDLLSKGAERDGKIYYEDATSTPYIEQTLRALAASSKTGKVTIIAHSNGGLVAKALLNKLGDAEAAKLVDKIIMVGVPQNGSPADIGSLLVGYGSGIYIDLMHIKGVVRIVSNSAARAFAQNSPMAYHLLPSEDYLESTAGDTAHPVVRFSGDGYAKEEAAYGATIANRAALDDFLLAKEGGRKKPAASDLDSAEILNPALIGYANSTHAALDVWTPPAGIEVDQIAGWGVDTVAGVNFYTLPGQAASTIATAPLRKYSPIFTEDGDGTVTIPSALMMASSTNVKRYWLNLDSYRIATSIKRSHADLFEIPSLQNFIRNTIQNGTSTLPSYISSVQPLSVTEDKKLTFFLHSPLTLQLTDASGNTTGLATDGSVTEDIPGSAYGEFGEVKYVTVPQGSQYQLAMHGQDSGTFSLDMQESSSGIVTASSTIAGVPTTASTMASMTISNGIGTASALTVDENGDGKNTIVITSKVGQTVNYEISEPVAEPQKAPTGGGAGGGSPTYHMLNATEAVATTSSPTTSALAPDAATNMVQAATTTLFIASTTPITTSPVSAATAPPHIAVAAVRSSRHQVTPSLASHIITAGATSDLSQTAAVYNALSEQSVLKKAGMAVYNSLYGFWLELKTLFHLK